MINIREAIENLTDEQKAELVSKVQELKVEMIVDTYYEAINEANRLRELLADSEKSEHDLMERLNELRYLIRDILRD